MTASFPLVTVKSTRKSRTLDDGEQKEGGDGNASVVA